MLLDAGVGYEDVAPARERNGRRVLGRLPGPPGRSGDPTAVRLEERVADRTPYAAVPRLPGDSRDNVSNTQAVRKKTRLSPVSSPSTSRCFTRTGARMAIPRSPFLTQRPSFSHALNPATWRGVKPRRRPS